MWDINAVLLRWTVLDGVGMIVHVAVVLITEYKVNLKIKYKQKKKLCKHLITSLYICSIVISLYFSFPHFNFPRERPLMTSLFFLAFLAFFDLPT